ncbi:MAG: DpnII family type II restriction endonuclease [Dehalococcoidales bacterium]|nr:DpnII family type II restriction endonuclease [Dehalococcoidales bacterium]
MADIDFYKKHLNLSTIDEICKVLSDTLIETNCTYDFFVNWTKVRKNRDAFKYELALLKSLKNCSDPVSDLRDLLKKYPEVIKVIPILLACRDGLLKVLNSIETGLQYHAFDFSKKKYDAKEIDDIVKFTKNTGLLDMLCQMDSATDYLLGVEVGLDTNARKNRSGLFLERMVTETLNELSARNSALVFGEQKTFGYVEDKYHVKIPPTLRDRKFDYSVINKGKATNIEVNFYSGVGSKPSEIVSSYINRGEVLSSAGWKFVWLTDGMGWRKMKNPLRVGVENIDYVMNAHLLRKGLLEGII